jgi:hypothetical protein
MPQGDWRFANPTRAVRCSPLLGNRDQKSGIRDQEKHDVFNPWGCPAKEIGHTPFIGQSLFFDISRPLIPKT